MTRPLDGSIRGTDFSCRRCASTIVIRRSRREAWPQTVRWDAGIGFVRASVSRPMSPPAVQSDRCSRLSLPGSSFPVPHRSFKGSDRGCRRVYPPRRRGTGCDTDRPPDHRTAGTGSTRQRREGRSRRGSARPGSGSRGRSLDRTPAERIQNHENRGGRHRDGRKERCDPSGHRQRDRDGVVGKCDPKALKTPPPGDLRSRDR